MSVSENESIRKYNDFLTCLSSRARHLDTWKELEKISFSYVNYLFINSFSIF